MQDAAAQAAKTLIDHPTSEQAIELLKTQGAEVAGEALNWLKHSAESAGDFIAEQAPLFIHEFLNWHFARAVVHLIVWSLVACILAIYAIRARRNCCRLEWNENDGRTFWWAITGAITMIASFIICVSPIVNNVEDIVKIKVAPRVYLVDWLAKEIKPQYPQ